MKQVELAALEALAAALARKARRHIGAGNSAPLLTIAPPPQHPHNKLDAITRNCAIRRIRLLERSYTLSWLVEQETFGLKGLDALDDDGIAALLKDMEAARICAADGESFEDAGLVRDTSLHLKNY